MTAARIEVPEKFIPRLLNPCPTVLVSAAFPPGQEGWRARAQFCAAAWCMPLDYKPPKAALVLAAGQATHDAVAATGELVLNVPGADLRDAVMKAGRTTGREIDKWIDLGLTPLPSTVVAAPGIAECLASLECRVLERDTALGRGLAEGYDLYLLGIVAARANPAAFHERWLLDKGVRLLHHLGTDGFEFSGGIL